MVVAADGCSRGKEEGKDGWAAESELSGVAENWDGNSDLFMKVIKPG